MAGAVAERRLYNAAARGYQVLFRPNETNRCPGCSRAQWFVGRVTAECVFCGTALPLAEAHWGESGGTPGRFAARDAERAESVDGSERRRHKRKGGEGRILQLLIDGELHAFTVHDISVGGLKAEMPEKLVSEREVQVVFEGGRLVPAKVRWAEGEFAGLSFTDPVLIDLTRTEKT